MSFTNESKIYAGDLDKDYLLATDSQDVKEVLAEIGYRGDDIKSVFTKSDDDGYTEVYGSERQFPRTDTELRDLLAERRRQSKFVWQPGDLRKVEGTDDSEG